MASSSADVVSNGVVQWSVTCDASVTSEDATSVAVAVAASISSVYATSSHTNAYVSCNGVVSGSTTSGGTSPGSTNGLTSASFGISKTQSAQTVACSARAWMPGSGVGAYQAGAEAWVSVTVPALASHAVRYDANGGGGAPGAQTKWYGSILTLSATVPARAGYAFQGWATSATGVVRYAAGGQYGADEDVTLYAAWRQLYVAPSFSAADAHRTTSATSTDTNPSGSFACASFSWAVDTSYTAGNSASSVVVAYRVAGADGWTSTATSGGTTGTGGTVTTHLPAELASSYEVRCTVTDSSGQTGAATSITRTVAVAAIPIDVGSSGAAVGILCAAPGSGLRVGADAEFTGDATVNGTATAARLKVSPAGHAIAGMWTGTTVVVTDGNGCADVMSRASVRTLTGGLDFYQTTDVFLVSNGDMNAAIFNATGAYYPNGDGLWVKTDKPNSMIRINWLLVCRR